MDTYINNNTNKSNDNENYYLYIYISVCVINDNVNIKDLINKSMDMGNQRNIGDFSLAIDWGFFHVKHGDLMLCIPHDVG